MGKIHSKEHISLHLSQQVNLLWEKDLENICNTHEMSIPAAANGVLVLVRVDAGIHHPVKQVVEDVGQA